MGSSSNTRTTIVWFRRDLRVEDNPALISASREGCVLPVFIWCPEEEGEFSPGRRSRWWLKHSLPHLADSLASLGAPLVLIKAKSTFAALLQCVNASGATKLVFNHLYDPVSIIRDHKIKTQLEELGISVQSFNGDLLYEPWEVYDELGLAFTNFDSYWKRCTNLLIESTFIFPPLMLVPSTGIEKIENCSIEDLLLETEAERPNNSFLKTAWFPGWINANKALNEFLNTQLLGYSRNRMKVDGTTTSLLSPYLHYGELSVKSIYRSVRMKQIQWAKEGNSEGEESVQLFLRSMGFREYSRYLCFNFPYMHQRSLLRNLRHYPWRADESQFKCWRQGKTGYPLVDAGMREFWATGWMHNRIRVITASFFVKFLLLPWTWGMKYFWDTLIDADLESDILGWQYISGSLSDGHELNRLDSPEVQGCKYDPEGHYVRSWLPELARMPSKWIHNPWNAPTSVLEEAGVELGVNYPKPIVDINTARERLDDAVAMMWKLDRDARSSKFHGSAEVVADNLNLLTVQVFDIPKVFLRRELSASSSFLAQRVSSVQNLKQTVFERGSEMIHGKKPLMFEIKGTGKFSIEISKMDEEDLSSTAESSASRKRSFS